MSRVVWPGDRDKIQSRRIHRVHRYTQYCDRDFVRSDYCEISWRNKPEAETSRLELSGLPCEIRIHDKCHSACRILKSRCCNWRRHLHSNKVINGGPIQLIGTQENDHGQKMTGRHISVDVDKDVVAHDQGAGGERRCEHLLNQSPSMNDQSTACRAHPGSRGKPRIRYPTSVLCLSGVTRASLEAAGAFVVRVFREDQ
jgi:hypothetical protein